MVNARLWCQKWFWYERNSIPWNRFAIHRELARRRAFARWPLHGNVLEAFREGRLEVGENTLFEPNVWLTSSDGGRIRIGSGTFLNIAVMVAAVELVEIGDRRARSVRGASTQRPRHGVLLTCCSSLSLLVPPAKDCLLLPRSGRETVGVEAEGGAAA